MLRPSSQERVIAMAKALCCTAVAAFAACAAAPPPERVALQEVDAIELPQGMRVLRASLSSTGSVALLALDPLRVVVVEAVGVHAEHVPPNPVPLPLAVRAEPTTPEILFAADNGVHAVSPRDWEPVAYPIAGHVLAAAPGHDVWFVLVRSARQLKLLQTHDSTTRTLAEWEDPQSDFNIANAEYVIGGSPQSEAVGMRTMHRLLSAGAFLATAFAAHAIDQTPEWRLQRELRLGSADGEHDSFITPHFYLLAAPDGSIFVPEPREGLIRRFDERGKHLGTFGRRGDGPGEFQSMRALGWAGDSLWIADARHSRVTWFDMDGKVLKTVTFYPTAFAAPNHVHRLQGVLADGSLLVAVEANPALDIKSLPLLKVVAGQRRADTVAVLNAGSTQISLRIGNSFHRVPNPGNRGTKWWVDPRGELIALVHAGPAQGGRSSFTVEAVRYTGQRLWSRSYPYTVPSWQQQTRQDRLRGLTETLVRTGVSRRDAERALNAAVPEGDLVPHPIPFVIVDHDQRIWLPTPGAKAGDVVWLVLSPRDGSVVGHVRGTMRERLTTAAGSSVWMTESDADHVPFLNRYRIAGTLPPR
jgi:hypothetical protein